MKNAVFSCLVAAAVTLLAACGPQGRDEPGRAYREGAREGAGTAAVEAPGAKGGSKDFSFTAGVQLAVPKGFPADVALYPGSDLKMAQKRSPVDFTVILATPDPASRAEEFYRRRMSEAGWEHTGEAGLEGERYLRYEKANEVVAINVDPEEERTVISIAYKKRY
jgi:hypothetical protein